MTREIPLKLRKKFELLIHNPATSGVLLIISTIIALIWANWDNSHSYHHFWDHTLLRVGEPDQLFYNVSLHHFVNDFLMAIFFFLTGLEIKREIKAGELSTMKKAFVPISAAIGGMVFPALIFAAFNFGQGSISGWGVPMATDIAFSLGVLALLQTRVPLSLKIFLTALAIADDIGAVLVIAIFYTDTIVVNELITAGTGLAILLIANYMGVRRRSFYYIVGILVVWVAFMYSGVHATIAGILVAFMVPSETKIDTGTYIQKSKKLMSQLEKVNDNEEKGIISMEKMNILLKQKELIHCAYNPLQYKEKFWHPIVNFFIMPVFALANAGVVWKGNFGDLISQPIFLGILFGLIIGKLLGVFLMTKIAQWLKIGELPKEINNFHIAGVGLLAGIGFTMSLFIANLAFFEPEQIELAKQAILITSFVSAISGYLLLYFSSSFKRGKTMVN
jgi:NhaA family Na+:H+ antiporter